LNESSDKLDVLNHFHYIKEFKRKNENQLRKGRIDIVIYENDGQDVFPIEIKGFDTPVRNKQRLLEDINRLLLFMGDETGHCNIKHFTIAFIQEVKVFFESEITESKEQIKNEYHNLLASVYTDYLNDFKFEVHTETVFDNLFKSQADLESFPSSPSGDDVGLDEVIDEQGLFVGVIITFCRKNHLNS
jgi:hypothetical protein